MHDINIQILKPLTQKKCILLIYYIIYYRGYIINLTHTEYI